jgi:hypothetical protein
MNIQKSHNFIVKTQTHLLYILSLIVIGMHDLKNPQSSQNSTEIEDT